MQVEPTSLFYATVIFLIKEDLLLDELIIGLYSPRVYYCWINLESVPI